jgi:hypothetical protein
MKKYWLKLIWLLFPLLSFSQSDLDEVQRRIKQEFSQAYLHWLQVRDQTWESEICQWDSIPEGAHYRSLEVNPVFLDGFAGLNLFEIEKTGDDLLENGSILSIRCSHRDTKRDTTETFLVALDHLGEIKYISGDLILNDIYIYLDGPGKSLAVAKSRTWFLNMESVEFLKSSGDMEIFGGYSRALEKKIRIAIVRGSTDDFRIWIKGKKKSPIQVVGDDSF